MHPSTCLAAGFTLLSVIVAPLAAQAQPRSLTPEEVVFVQAFNEATKNAGNNRLIQGANDWDKTDHAQDICRAFRSGSSVDDVSTSLAKLSFKLKDESLRKEFTEYASVLVVVGTRTLCSEYVPMLNEYLRSL